MLLVVAAVTVIPSVSPSWRPAQELTTDLAAARVSYIEYDRGSGMVRWVVDQVRWREADVPPPPDVDQQTASKVSGDVWVEQQIEASGRHVTLVTVQDGGPRLWTLRVPWAPLRYAAIAVCALTLIQMLASGGHRVANRWAWFWMFSIGQVGALLYLLREPVPLWRSEVADTGRAPMGGGFGFLFAIGLAIATAIVGSAVALALR